MILFRGMLIDERIFRTPFVCRLSACKGRCCIEGEEGAPITAGERRLLERAMPRIIGRLTPAARHHIRRFGFCEEKRDGWSLQSLPDGQCVFARWGANGALECVLEVLHRQGKTGVPKPISCRLYPLRLDRMGDMLLLRFDEWDICAPARVEGRRRCMPAYAFVREALVAHFGAEWYEELAALAHEYLQQPTE